MYKMQKKRRKGVVSLVVAAAVIVGLASVKQTTPRMTCPYGRATRESRPDRPPGPGSCRTAGL